MFQAGWLTCVVSLSNQQEWLSSASLLILIAVHLYLTKSWRTEIKIILIAGLTGLCIDSVLIAQNVFSGEWNIAINGLAPLWLIGLWMLFGTTINHSLAWFKDHLWLSALAGLVFAPLAYWAGYRFGVLYFPEDVAHYWMLLIIGACWFVVTPFLLWLSTIFEKRANAVYSG